MSLSLYFKDMTITAKRNAIAKFVGVSDGSKTSQLCTCTLHIHISVIDMIMYFTLNCNGIFKNRNKHLMTLSYRFIASS